MISGSPEFWVVPGPDPCYGSFFFAESNYVACGYTGVFRVRDLCETYEDIIVVYVPPFGNCQCPFQADMNGDGFVDSTDLSLLIDIVFFGGLDTSDPGCPGTRADFNQDCFVDTVDLSAMIDHVFFGGAPPIDPCAGPGSNCLCP